MVDGRLFTVAQVADRAQVHRKTVERAIARGELEASQLGERGAIRITAGAFDRWFAVRRVQPRAAGTDVAVSAPGGRRRGRLVVHDGMGRSAA